MIASAEGFRKALEALEDDDAPPPALTIADAENAYALWQNDKAAIGMVSRSQQDLFFWEMFYRLALHGEDNPHTLDGIVPGEGPTGIGKTAIVTPLRAFCGKKGRIIVSAYTRAQQGIVFDALERAHGKGIIDKPPRRLYGASNYLCYRRWSSAYGDAGIPAPPPLDRRPKVREGTRDEYRALGGDWVFSDRVWRAICSDTEAGCDTRCDDHYRAARARAVESGACVVVNHSLLALDRRIGGRILQVNDHDVIVVDEAHNLPGVVMETFGGSVSSFAFTRVIARLRDAGPDSRDAQRICSDLSDRLDDILRTYTLKGDDSTALVVTRPEAELDLKLLRKSVESLRALVLKHATSGDGATDARARMPWELAGDALGSIAANLGLVIAAFAHGSNEAAWVEQVRGVWTYRKLEARQMHIAPVIQRILGEARAAVLMSATMSGIPLLHMGFERYDLVVGQSPFDLVNDRVGWHAPPLPNAMFAKDDERGDIEVRHNERWKFDKCLALVRDNGGATLVIAKTSAVPVDGLGRGSQLEMLADYLAGQGLRVMAQKGEKYFATPAEMRAALLSGNVDVVIGTATLREGFDVPGEGLSQICLLQHSWPYAGDPLLDPLGGYYVRNRMVGGSATGYLASGGAWRDINAAQAIGRLVRWVGDVGRVAFLDRRESEIEKFVMDMRPSSCTSDWEGWRT